MPIMALRVKHIWSCPKRSHDYALGLLAFPIPIPESDEFFVALCSSAKNDEETMPCVLTAARKVATMAPTIDLPCALATAALPREQGVVPALLQPAARR